MTYKTFDIPNEVLTTMHVYMVVAHALAMAASEQPPMVKGEDPKRLMAIAADEALENFGQRSPQEKADLLRETAVKLAQLSGATAVIIDPHPRS